jgi:hypothetical protein
MFRFLSIRLGSGELAITMPVQTCRTGSSDPGNKGGERVVPGPALSAREKNWAVADMRQNYLEVLPFTSK